MGRRLGQHFLADTNILDRIVDAIDPDPDDVVLEIGAGQGTLTRRLGPRVGRVIAIEKDERLTGEAGDENGEARREKGDAQIVFGDALHLDWHALLRMASPASPISLLPSRLSHPHPSPSFKIIGNIPYYITTPLIDKALTPPLPSVIVFLVQREVAERVVAMPGSKTYGALSIGVRVLAKAEKLFVVKPGAFRPPPKVDSAVLRLTPLADPLIAEGERHDVHRFLAALFGQRRKQLKRSLREITSLEREEVEARLQSLGVDPAARGEVLGPVEMIRLFRAFRESFG